MWPGSSLREPGPLSQSESAALQGDSAERNIPTLFIHNHYQNEQFDSVEMSDARAGYELTRMLIQNGHPPDRRDFQIR